MGGTSPEEAGRAVTRPPWALGATAREEHALPLRTGESPTRNRFADVMPTSS